MKFVYLHKQRAVNIDHITDISVAGSENNATVEVNLDDGKWLTASHHKDLQSAEIALANLVRKIENTLHDG